MSTLLNAVFSGHTKVLVTNLRNGTAKTENPTIRASSIATSYFWSQPKYDTSWIGDEATLTSALPAAVLIDVAVRETFAAIVSADAALRNTASGTTTLPATFADARAVPGSRTAAIILGGARASVAYSYRVGAADLSISETSTGVLKLVAAPPAADDVVFAVQEGTVNAGWTVTLASGNATANHTDDETSAFSMDSLTSDESQLAFIAFTLAVAAVPRAGDMLSKTNHHYFSDSAARSRHMACEKQVLKLAGAAAKALWNDAGDMAKDLVWHASIHPVSMVLLKSIARKPTIKDLLDASGYGSFSVGLPSKEDVVNRAGSYLECVRAVASTMTRHNHAVTTTRLESLISAFESVSSDESEWKQTKPSWVGSVGVKWPDVVTDRKSALNYYMVPELDSMSSSVAFAFGYYISIAEDADVKKTSVEGSLLRSWSLNKLKTSDLGGINHAQTIYLQYKKYLKAEAAEGKLEQMKISL